MALFRPIAAAAAFAATVSMTAGSALAVELPAAAAPAAVYQADKAEGHRWGRYRRDRVDAGDVLAGVLILGTIAAVASAARNGNADRDRDYRYPDRREPWPQDRQRYDSRSWDDGSSGLDRAVDMCVDEVERDRGRVGAIDGANRTGDGWDVRGQMEGGAGFTCRIGNDGRIRAIDVGGSQAYAPAVEDRQYDAEVYARARAAGPGTAPVGEADDRPVWTGDDGRYGASATPDFDQAG